MSKYYTPEIEEFHVGFEYEKVPNIGMVFLNTDSPEKTSKSIWATEFEEGIWGVKEVDPFLGDGLPSIRAAITDKKIRVKYLDREDIESCGFVCHATDNRVYHNKDGIIINTEWGSPVKQGITLVIVSPVFDESKMNIVHENYLFNGTIKNKSELKKLLKQLGI